MGSLVPLDYDAAHNWDCKSCSSLSLDLLYQQALDHPPGSKGGWNQAGYLVFHPSFGTLCSSAQNGCPNCTFYVSQFNASYGDNSAIRKQLKTTSKPSQPTPIIMFLGLTIWEGTEGWKRYITRLYLQIGTKAWKAGDDGERLCVSMKINAPLDAAEREGFKGIDFRYTEIDYDLGSDANFALARKWIEECCQEHAEDYCPEIADQTLPKRVIDVGSEDGEEVRLVEMDGGVKGKYLALSHCWGVSVKGERVITTKSNLDERKRGIPLFILPANFRDACIVTRKLGYRYVWIDSLCIIQNSVEDWETESAKMGDIYMKATLTIAAAAANDSDGGMLETHYLDSDFGKFEPQKWFMIDRKKTNRYAISEPSAQSQRKVERCEMRVRLGDYKNTISLTPWMQFSDLEENFFRCVVVGPLAHRGWTLQERTLSYRTLYYGNRQIYWQCPLSRKAADGEVVPVLASTSSWTMSSDHSEWPDLLGLKRLSKLTPEGEIAIHTAWRTILQIYVARDLTKQTDKLPALAGMAAYVHSITGDQYLAGFWRRDLLVSLIWTPIPNFITAAFVYLNQLTGPPQWEQRHPWLEGPSWSWASAPLEDKLEFWGQSDENRIWKGKDAEIIDANVSLIGKNPFGRVKKGNLVVKGYTYRRWDNRVKGWNPMEPGWYGIWDAISDVTCLNSVKRELEAGPTDRVVLWDYPARHGQPFFAKRLQLLVQILLSLFAIIFFQGRARQKQIHDERCPYCVECLCLHVLSACDGETRRNKKGERFNEVNLWSLILEPVKGEMDAYRRVGIARKDIVLDEAVYSKWAKGRLEDPEVPKVFEDWEIRTVNII
jgi:hypothetical protein